MKVFFQDIQASTRNRTELGDITRSIKEIVQKSNIENGLCIIQSVHSTTAIIVNEHEAGLTEDIVNKIKQDYPKEGGWLHDRVDDNANARLASSFVGSTSVSVRDGRLERGTWQNIFLLELDGPRSRRILVEIMGE